MARGGHETRAVTVTYLSDAAMLMLWKVWPCMHQRVEGRVLYSIRLFHMLLFLRALTPVHYL